MLLVSFMLLFNQRNPTTTKKKNKKIILSVQPRTTTVLPPHRKSLHQTDLPPFVPNMPRKLPSDHPRAFTRLQKFLHVSHALHAPPPATTLLRASPDDNLGGSNLCMTTCSTLHLTPSRATFFRHDHRILVRRLPIYLTQP